jgi:HPt (histidine-containing phosphotransfer) domain-containing protein
MTKVPEEPHYASAAPSAAAVPADHRLHGVIDEALLLKRVHDNMDLLRDLVELFLDNSPCVLAEIRAAIARDDAKALALAAHSLKASAGNFSAAAAYDAAKRLEIMGGNCDLRQAAPACTALETQVERLKWALTVLVENGAA